MLNVKDIVFDRGENGQLIAQEVELDAIEGKPTVKVVPLTRGKLQEIYAKANGSVDDKIDADNMAIQFGLVEPKLTEEQIRDLKPTYAAAITTAIMSASLGVTQKEVENQAKVFLEKEESNLKKN